MTFSEEETGAGCTCTTAHILLLHHLKKNTTLMLYAFFIELCLLKYPSQNATDSQFDN